MSLLVRGAFTISYLGIATLLSARTLRRQRAFEVELRPTVTIALWLFWPLFYVYAMIRVVLESATGRDA